MALGGKIDYFCETVFNYPTMAECFRVAAFNGLLNLQSLDLPAIVHFSAAVSSRRLSGRLRTKTDWQEIVNKSDGRVRERRPIG